jgi:hypothetical protein
VGPRTGLDDVEKRKYCPYRDSNSDPLAVQPVASHYTDCAIPATYRAYFKRYGRAVVAYFKVFSQNSLGGTEKSHEIPQDSQCPGRDLNQASSEYKSEALSLEQPLSVIHVKIKIL